MPSWLVGHEVEAIIALVALMALVVSIHAERRVSRLSSLEFPGVDAVWINVHKAGPREHGPPLEADIQEIHLSLKEREDQFSIADVRLTRWDEYWGWYGLRRRNAEGGTIILYVTKQERRMSDYPEFLRVKVERRGGVQAKCWHRVRVELPF